MALSHRFCYAMPLGFGMCLQDAGCLCGQHWVAACLGFAGVFEVDGASVFWTAFPDQPNDPARVPVNWPPFRPGTPDQDPFSPCRQFPRFCLRQGTPAQKEWFSFRQMRHRQREIRQARRAVISLHFSVPGRLQTEPRIHDANDLRHHASPVACCAL